MNGLQQLWWDQYVVGFVFGGFKKSGRRRFLEFSEDVFPWWAVVLELKSLFLDFGD